MKNILVPLDLSAIGPAVLNVAEQLAAPLGAKLWLLHVAAPEPDFVGYDAGPTYVRDQRADELRKEHVEMQEMAAGSRARGLDCEALLVQGPTTDTLLQECVRLKIDMIVMGSHGRSALYKTFVGSVSEQVLTNTTVPVLVVPPSDRK
ncbi:MAG: universal stress protein [Flavobacteriales bacterium]|nr:universal stress protein [Flavobacteriales bacterium]